LIDITKPCRKCRAILPVEPAEARDIGDDALAERPRHRRDQPHAARRHADDAAGELAPGAIKIELADEAVAPRNIEDDADVVAGRHETHIRPGSCRNSQRATPLAGHRDICVRVAAAPTEILNVD